MNTVGQLIMSPNISDRESAAKNPDKTAEQIIQLFYDPEPSVIDKLFERIDKDKLSEQEIKNFFDTNEEELIKLLIDKRDHDKEFDEILMNSQELKTRVFNATF